MLLAGLVVENGLALHGLLRDGARDAPLAVGAQLPCGHREFQGIECRPRVAVREVHNEIKRLVVDLGPERREAAITVRDGPLEDRAHVLGPQELELEDPAAAEQGPGELERRVLGRRADERDRAGLHVREERVLLCLVESVDLIYEQNRGPLFGIEPLACLRDYTPDLRDARKHRAETGEVGARDVRDDPGQRSLPRPRRPP